MDYNKNADKILDRCVGVSYGQVSDVVRASFGADLFSVADFKSYAKIDNPDEDTLIGLLIGAAQRMVENYVGVSLKAREITATINNYNGGAYLPYGPVGAITSVTDIDGNVIPDTSYKLLGTDFKKVLWPLMELVFTYTGGYTTCPPELLDAVKAQTLYLYENRGDVTAYENTKSRTMMSPVAQLILNPLIRA